MTLVQLAAARRARSRSCSSRRACSAPTSPKSSAAARPRATGSSLPVERLLYRVCGVDSEREQTWPVYALALLAFSLVSVLGLYLLQRSRAICRSTPPTPKAVPPALAFNTAVSFLTNTNWQNYGGESTMSHLTQMAGLAVHNFVSAAVGAGGRRRADPRPRAPALAHDRQLLGRPHARHDPRPAAARVRRRASCS